MNVVEFTNYAEIWLYNTDIYSKYRQNPLQFKVSLIKCSLFRDLTICFSKFISLITEEISVFQ